MKDGWIQQVGEPLELYGHPTNKFVAGFIGSPAMNFLDVGINETNGAIVAETQGLHLEVPPARAAAVRAYKGQQVAFGIRPEDVHIATGADAVHHTFDAVVEVVEPLGSEILLDVRVGRGTIVARVDPTVRVKIHETVRLAVNADRLHFFDAKTEQAI